MKSNLVIFLGFLIICLVNLTAQKPHHDSPPPAPKPAKAQVKAISEPDKDKSRVASFPENQR